MYVCSVSDSNCLRSRSCFIGSYFCFYASSVIKSCLLFFLLFAFFVCFCFDNAFQPKTIRNTPELNRLGALLVVVRATTYQWEPYGISVRRRQKRLTVGFRLVLGHLGEGTRKWGLALYWML